MRDPRITPNPDDLQMSEPAQIGVPVVDLTRGPNGSRDRQLLYGDPVTILNRLDDHCLIQSHKDGYCGTVPASAVTHVTTATHHVTARATHAYSAPDFKAPERAMLSFGATLTALSETPTFIETPLGFVPRQHVHGADTVASDPAYVAALFLGAPYLWGGNTSLGIDCSGLVQAACLACHIPCPGDSDQQASDLGIPLSDGTTLHRNDLVFWKGHVALITDDETLIHANAGHMMVTYEPIADAIARIELQGDGLPTHRKRLPKAR